MAVTLARPEALVTAVVLESVEPAPDAGGVKVMVMPLCGVPALSLKSTWSAVPKAVPTVVLCGVPPVAAMLGGGTAVLVSENAALRAFTPAVTE